MITESVIQINAPSSVVWEVFVDVERWPEWTASVSRITPLDGGDLAVGHRFEIKQPRLPRLVWQVADLSPGTAWSWHQRSTGANTLATHEVMSQPDGSTLVRQTIDQRGPIGSVVGALTRRLTRRYLELEAQGLKTRSEERVRGAAPT